MSWFWSDRADRGKIESTTSPVTTPEVTVSAWAKWLTDDSANDDNIFQIADSTSGSIVMRLGLQDSGADNLNSYFGGTNYQTVGTLGAGVWEHCCHQWNGANNQELFLNGSGDQVSMTDSVAHTTFDKMTIGAEGDSTPSDWWQGRLAEVAVWDVKLEVWEVDVLAAGFSALCLTHRLGNLVVYEPLDSPILNRYLIHANAPTFVAGFDSGGNDVAPVYDADHPIIFRPMGQEIYIPPAAAGPVAQPLPSFFPNIQRSVRSLHV